MRAAVLIPGLAVAWRVARSGVHSQGIAARRDSHARYWAALAGRPGNVRFVAIGDSTAQGLGAREPAGSYVGQLERQLNARLEVINLSLSGARLADIRAALLPRLATLELDHALVTFAAGANDIVDFDPNRFHRDLALILDALPAHALVAELPSFYVPPYQARVRAANAILHELADARDLTVVPLFATTNRLGPLALASHHAGDLFHPNDWGYRLWARAFLGPASARLEAIATDRAARAVQPE